MKRKRKRRLRRWVKLLLAGNFVFLLVYGLSGLILREKGNPQSFPYQSLAKDSYCIMLEAGYSEGATNENDIALAFILKLDQQLKKQGYCTLLTRYDDSLPSFKEKQDLLSKNHPALFIGLAPSGYYTANNGSFIKSETSQSFFQENLQKALSKCSKELHDFISESILIDDPALEGIPAVHLISKADEAQISSLFDKEALQDELAFAIITGIENYLARMNIELYLDPNKENLETMPYEKVIYLTIDDGPSRNTERLLSILHENKVQATFFVTAQFLQTEALLTMLKKIDEAGHTVASHSYSHDYQEIYLSPEAFMEDYRKMNDLILQATGKSTSLFRFPGGSNTTYNQDIRQELFQTLNSEGLIWVDWNAFTGDTEGKTKEEMLQKAIQECSARRKIILLMHDAPGKESVLEILPELIETMKEKGYVFRRMNETVAPIQFIRPEDQ